MNQRIDFKSKTQALDALKTECIYTDMSKFAHTYFATQVEPLNLIGVCQKLDTPPKWSNVFEWQIVKTLKNVMSNHVSNHSDIANMPKYGYAVDLSKFTSVTPQRHCGFIVPKFCIGSQSMLKIQGASVSATHTRLQSLYEGMTRQNKVLPNMSGGSSKPRVNPLTLISQVMVILNSKLLGAH